MPRRLLTGVLLLAVMFGPADLMAEEITTGSALPELVETPPSPPAGFATPAEVMQALQQGHIRIVQLPPPDDAVAEQKNVEYGRVDNRRLLLDLYTPANLKAPAPGIILIHGGGWKGGRKEDYTVYGRRLAAKGYVVASIDYRLSDEARFPAALEDCKCAVRWMRANADTLNVYPDTIGVGGGSAGGHLSLLVGYCDSETGFDNSGGHSGISSKVQCIVDLYGPSDLTTDFVRRNKLAGTLVSGFLGKSIDEAPDLYRRASPINYVSKDSPPTLILHGTVDDVVPIDQSDALAEKLTELKVPHIYDRLPGWPHAMDLSQEVNDRCLWFMERFFARYLQLPEGAPQ